MGKVKTYQNHPKPLGWGNMTCEQLSKRTSSKHLAPRRMLRWVSWLLSVSTTGERMFRSKHCANIILSVPVG